MGTSILRSLSRLALSATAAGAVATAAFGGAELAPFDGGDSIPPQVILESQKTPEYPPAARSARYEGVVTVDAEIDVDGIVREVRIIECSRPKVGFEEAAVSAVKQWRFDPAVEAGQPVAASLRLRLNFSLAKGVPRVSAGVNSAGRTTPAVAAAAPGRSDKP